MTVTIKPEHMIAVNQEDSKNRRRTRIYHTRKYRKWEHDEREYSTPRKDETLRRQRARREHADLLALGIDVEQCFA